MPINKASGGFPALFLSSDSRDIQHSTVVHEDPISADSDIIYIIHLEILTPPVKLGLHCYAITIFKVDSNWMSWQVSAWFCTLHCYDWLIA